MKLYFSLKSIPELSNLSPAERRLAWHACKGMAWRRWRTWAATLAGVAVGTGLAYAAMMLVFNYRFHLHRTLGLGWLAIFFTMGFVGGGILVGVTQLVRWPVVAGQVRACLREYVKEREIEIQQIREEVARDIAD